MSNEHELLILGEESLAVNPRRPVLTDLGCLRPPHGVPIKELHVPQKTEDLCGPPATSSRGGGEITGEKWRVRRRYI